MIRLAALAVLIAFSAVAQPSNAPPLERRVVEVKNLRGPRLEQAVKLLTTFLMPGGDANSFPELNAVVLRGTAETVAAAETMLKKFDVPGVNPHSETKVPESYQIRVHLVLASPDQEGAGSVPAEIEPAIQQMKKTFLYKSYKLLDTVILQGVAGSATQLQGMVANSAFQNATFSTQIKGIHPLADGKAVHLRGFQFVVRKPAVMVDAKFPVAVSDARLDTDLYVKTGQKLVVGKLALEQNGSTIFLIITAEPVS